MSTVRGCVPLWPAITRDRWLHHTSFLWDFNAANMEYLLIPESQPECVRVAAQCPWKAQHLTGLMLPTTTGTEHTVTTQTS